MEQYFKEPTPVQYNAVGIKKHHYFRYKNGVRLHWHDRMELIRLHSGKLQVGYGDNKAMLLPGQIYIIPPKTPHAAQLASETVEYDVLMFDVRWFYNQTEICQNSLKCIFDGRAYFDMTTEEPTIVNCFDRLFTLCDENSMETVGLVYQLLQLLMNGALTQLSRTPRGDALILDTLAYIEENFAQDIGTDQLAQRCGYSSAHFCRKFKESTWLTPMNYLRIYRLEEAARMLRQGSGTVSDVAMACGFPDPNYFTRCFKKHFGVPPTRYEK